METQKHFASFQRPLIGYFSFFLKSNNKKKRCIIAALSKREKKKMVMVNGEHPNGVKRCRAAAALSLSSY